MKRLLIATLLLAAALPGTAHAAFPKGVEIRRGPDGTPHITARTWQGLGYGFAWAHAEDNLCVLANTYVTVRAERSRYFGPDASYPIENTGTKPNNLNSDFFWQRVKDEKVVERLADLAPPEGPEPELKELARGFLHGYNAFVRERFPSYTDPACAGKPWVVELDQVDVYRRIYQLSLLASQMAALDGIGGAQPLTPALPAGATIDHTSAARALPPGEIDRRLHELGLGSNAVALGRGATENGKGLLLGNPHQPWQGSERFYQSHLTIPGELDVSGASLYGSPLVNIGFNRTLAWSHTVSTARRFAIYEETLVPGSPTTYLRDGRPKEMKRSTVTVQALTAGGKLEPRTRTLYSTDHGPMLTSILGLPIFPWTPVKAYSMNDANAGNFGRLVNHFLAANRARTTKELDAALRKHLGIPWVTTTAADADGDAYFADIGSVPNVSDAKLASCPTALGLALDQLQRVQVLDGSRTACDPEVDPTTPSRGIMPAARQPALTREDYVTNSNDSYWLSNPEQPLTGYDRIIGDEGTERSLRTRNGLKLIQRGLANGGRFSRQELEDLLFDDELGSATLWKDELVAYCRANPTVPSSAGPVAVGRACDVLAAWDGKDAVDARGALLFRRFASRAVDATPSPWDVPFDAADPVNTPRGLNTDNPQVALALGDAITDLADAKIPIDAPLGDYQYERRGEKLPLHGGLSELGSFNVIQTAWNPALPGYTGVTAGGTYIQAVAFGVDRACPVSARTHLGHGLATDPTSPDYNAGTKRYSRKQWTEQPFCARDVARRTTTAVRRLRARARGRVLSVTVDTTTRAGATVTILRGGRRVKRLTLTGAPGRKTTKARLKRGRYVVRAEANGTRLTKRVEIR